MTVSPIHRLLVDARSSISGDFSSTSRITDILLDIRHLAESDPNTAALVDSILASIPGRSVVPNEWWRAQLDDLERHGDQSSSGPWSQPASTPIPNGPASPVSGS